MQENKSDRPIKILLDNQNLLHGEREAVLKYADGFKTYADRGMTIPEKYGSVHPSLWKREWLSTESDSQYRKMLMKEFDNKKNKI